MKRRRGRLPVQATGSHSSHTRSARSSPSGRRRRQQREEDRFVELGFFASLPKINLPLLGTTGNR